MFGHYLKIAFRNMRKYWLQNAVNVLGLALGFVCLSLSIIWIRYENSFDTFHKDADRLFTVSLYQPNDGFENHNVACFTSLHDKVLELPEVEDYTQFVANQFRLDGKDGIEYSVDRKFFEFFNMKAVLGSDAFKTTPGMVAITRSFAEELYPGQDPVGKELPSLRIRSHYAEVPARIIGAVLENFPGRTELDFDVISIAGGLTDEGRIVLDIAGGMNLCLKVREGTDIDKFTAKADELLCLEKTELEYRLTPVTLLHRKLSKKTMYISFEQVKMFCLAGIVLFLCAMVNFIMFSLVRLDYRKREMALRMVNGSSARKLYAMLMVEYGTVLLVAMGTGLVMNILLAPVFSSISAIGMEQMHIIAWSLAVMIPVLAISLVICTVSVWSVRHRSMQASISKRREDTFRKVCIGVQLFISILFIFVVAVMLKQFATLRNHDWGMRINNTAVIEPKFRDGYYRTNDAPDYYPPFGEDESTYAEKDFFSGRDYLNMIDGQAGVTAEIRELPYVTGEYFGVSDGVQLYETARYEAMSNPKTVNGTGFSHNGRYQKFLILDILNSDALDFMDLTVIDGEIPDRPIGWDEIVVTENMVKDFDLGPVSTEPTLTIGHKMTNPYGQEFVQSYTFRVIAVVKDIYAKRFNPDDLMYYAFCARNNRKLMPKGFSVLDRYEKPVITVTFHDGMARRLRSDIDRIMSDAGLEYTMRFTEDHFYEGLKSQRHLRNMIMAVGGVCILIALFGIWSMIMLACQERRREIAVRKVHGARKRDILKIFGREYGGMLVVTSAFAFAVGYIIMHRWLQQYEQQTAISWWLYLLILVGMALVISLTVLHRVSRAAGENPSVVIKNE